MPSEETIKVKQKIIDWLKEEACSPVEETDPNAFFNITAKVGKLGCQIVQPVNKTDSFIVAGRVVLPPEMLEIIKSMNSEKKTALFWDLRLSLVSNSELLDFQIESDTQEDIKAIGMSSRPIFYDSFTKERLFSAMFGVTRAVLMMMWMIQKHAGKLPPRKDQKVPYST